MYRLLICVLLVMSIVLTVTAQSNDNASPTESLLIDDFETGELFTAQDATGNDLGYIAWSETDDNVRLRLSNVIRGDESTNALFVRTQMSELGGFSHIFNDGEAWATQDWSDYNAIQFLFLGEATEDDIVFELFDNRNPDIDADTAERWSYTFTDDSPEWRLIQIPFHDLQRSSEQQASDAPDDGLTLTEVSGYGLAFPIGTATERAYIDNVEVVALEENPDGTVITTTRITRIDIDESIEWDSREWELMWSDEFDLEAGEPLNMDYWNCELGGWGWGNSELEYYTCRTENVVHDGNGNLVITAREEAVPDDDCWYGECTNTSARLTTQDKVEFTHGRVEARINIPQGQGIWPAFWMLGADFPEVGWPQSGEIDIMENIGRERFTIHGTIHGPGYSGAGSLGRLIVADEPYADDFHVFAIDWDPYVIRWYVDGEMYGIISVNSLNGKEWVYEHDFFLLLNVAVGGEWPGPPNLETEFPQEMLIDYVRVYQLAE